MTNEPTASELELEHALREEAVTVIPHPSERYKTVDLRSKEARVDIEVDDIQHVVSAKQINRDLDRAFYSHEDGNATLHVRNTDIRDHLKQIAHAIAGALRFRAWRMRRHRRLTSNSSQ